MTTATITQRGKIKARCALREEFSKCSSGNGSNSYYETKGHAVRAYESALAKYGLYFDPDDLMDMPGDIGHVVIDIYTDGLEYTERVGCAMLMWYRMPSGRWEFTGYIA